MSNGEHQLKMSNFGKYTTIQETSVSSMSAALTSNSSSSTSATASPFSTISSLTPVASNTTPSAPPQVCPHPIASFQYCDYVMPIPCKLCQMEPIRYSREPPLFVFNNPWLQHGPLRGYFRCPKCHFDLCEPCFTLKIDPFLDLFDTRTEIVIHKGVEQGGRNRESNSEYDTLVRFQKPETQIESYSKLNPTNSFLPLTSRPPVHSFLSVNHGHLLSYTPKRLIDQMMPCSQCQELLLWQSWGGWVCNSTFCESRYALCARCVFNEKAKIGHNRLRKLGIIETLPSAYPREITSLIMAYDGGIEMDQPTNSIPHEEVTFQTPDWQTGMKSLIYSQDKAIKWLVVLPVIILGIGFLSSIIAIIIGLAVPCDPSLWLVAFGILNLIHLSLFLCSNKFSCQYSNSLHCIRCIVDTLLFLDFLIIGIFALTYLSGGHNCSPPIIGVTIVVGFQLAISCITSTLMCCYSWSKFGKPLGALCFASLNLNIWDID